MNKALVCLLIILASCSKESPPKHEIISFKNYLNYNYKSQKNEYRIDFTRQSIKYSESVWTTENILDSVYTIDKKKVFKSYYNLIDTVVYDYLKNKGINNGIVIEENQNKSHLELIESNDSITFKRITYSRPKILNDYSFPEDTVVIFNEMGYRNYLIRGQKFKVYCFGSFGRCNDCDETIYFSKELGLIANYSVDWGHLSLVDSINNKKKLELINSLKMKLELDTLFFPNPINP